MVYDQLVLKRQKAYLPGSDSVHLHVNRVTQGGRNASVFIFLFLWICIFYNGKKYVKKMKKQ